MGGRPLRYINVSVEELKEVAISVLEVSQALGRGAALIGLCRRIFLLGSVSLRRTFWERRLTSEAGCDVEKASSMDLGIMDTALYNVSR